MKPSGSIFYQDEYLTNYYVKWETVGDVIDYTSTVGQPYVWGKDQEGYSNGNILYRLGVITVERMIIRPLANGYEIVADGVSQYEGYVQANFPCQEGPKDTFKFHLNHPIVDDFGYATTTGPRWADPDEVNDVDMVWCDLDVGGSPLPVSGTPLEFIDVWS